MIFDRSRVSNKASGSEEGKGGGEWIERERVKVDPAPGAGAGAGAGGAGGGESVAQRRDTRLYSRTRAQAGKRPSTHLNYCPPPPRLPPATRHYTIDPLHAIEPTPLSSAG